jgi:hypothetical protein
VRSYFASNPDPEFIGIILSTRTPLRTALSPLALTCWGLWTCTTGQGIGSWPLATFGSFVYHSAKMEDCAKSRALASFLDWTQNSPQSRLIAQR